MGGSYQQLNCRNENLRKEPVSQKEALQGY